jgi:hypothetical protein
MATAVTSQKVASIAKMKQYDHDPGSTGAVVVSGDGGTTKNYVNIQNFEVFALLVMNSVSTSSSGPTLVEIVAAEDSTGTNVTAILTSGTIASTHVGDNIYLEVTAAQIQEVGAAAGFKFTHATGRITCSNSGDECVVMQGAFQPRWPQKDLTANAIT